MVGRLLAHANPYGGDDLTDANLPPPSTLAAQLVKNHIDSARGLPQPDTIVPFRQLLQELLNKNSVPETDVETNHKLIKVVVEAGLDVLSQENPFPQWDVLLSQATDSLAVIQSTILKSPDILFFQGPKLPPAQRPHLLLWLFPKLLTTLKHPEASRLQDALASLLSSVILLLSKSMELWPHVKPLLHMFRDCITDISSLLQNAQLFSKFSAEIPAVALPPVRSTSDVWPGTDDNATLSLGSQLSTNDALSVVRIQFLLLATLRDLVGAKNTVVRFQTATFPIYKWVFDSITPLARVLLQHRSWFEQHSCFSSFALQALRFYIFLQGSLDPTIQTRTPYLLGNLCDYCSKLVTHDSKCPLAPELQQELAKVVETIFDRYNAEFEHIIEESLLPSLRFLARDSSRFESTDESLRQVIERRLSQQETNGQRPEQTKTTTGQNQPDIIMRDYAIQAPDQDPLPQGTFSSSSLGRRQMFLRRGIQTLQKPEAADSNDSSTDPYSILVENVALLLGRGNGSGLSGLHNDAA